MRRSLTATLLLFSVLATVVLAMGLLAIAFSADTTSAGHVHCDGR
jgi:hypothetical protein